MRLVTWHEFIRMPEGTIYSEVYRHSLDALVPKMKGETWTEDFLETDLLPMVEDVYVSGYKETEGSDILVSHPSGWGRDGLFEKDRKFWVWEQEDRERLAKWLLNPFETAAGEELNEDNFRWHGKYRDLEVAA